MRQGKQHVTLKITTRPEKCLSRHFFAFHFPDVNHLMSFHSSFLILSQLLSDHSCL